MSGSARDDIVCAIEPPPAATKRWTVQRTAGHALMSLWVIAGLGLIVFLVSSWDTRLFERYAPNYVSGLIITIQLVVISFFLGVILSIPVAYGRTSRNKWLAWPTYAYVYFFRGTPLLAQIFLIYYGIGSFRPQLEAIGLWVFFREAWYCGILAFTLNTAAYQAEILRGAIQAIPKGQWEGAASLGLHRPVILGRIILPQALIVALRPYGNEFILLIKGSAIIAIITVYDLMGETRRAYSQTFDFQMYIWAALIYLVIVETLRHIVDWLERRLTWHLNR